jgi:hypothetical protein
MASNSWKDIAELVGIAAIVLSLIFVGVQLRLERDISIVEARSGLTDRVIYLTEIINNEEDVWKRGLDNEELTSVEEMKYQGLYKAVRSHIFTQWVRWGRVGPIDPDYAPENLAYALYSHAGLRRVHMDYASFTRDSESAFNRTTPANDFDGQVLDYLKVLDRTRPVPNRQYIFW